MSTKDFTANVISASKVVPDGNFKDSKASGIWDINEALDLIKGGNWPNVANINPSAFVDALFSTHLYYGTNSAQTITNNIDLSGKGGLVWQKMRVSDNDASDTQDHYLRDTARGGGYRLNSNTRNAQASDGGITAFNSNGFSLSSGSAGNVNQGNYVSWTFRKQPKFFDIQTYTGNGSVRNISHNLGSVPGMIIVKCTSAGSSYWTVYHRALDASSPEDKYVYLDSTNAVGDFTGYWNDTAPTSSVFTLGTGNGDDTNANGETYVAYLFAHNNDDGGFGEPGDQDIIKCGGYTGTGASGNKINLGFEPQWLLIKDTNDTNSWVITDTMRGLTSSTAAGLFANVSNVEFNSSGYAAALHADGFTPTGSNGNNTTYIYMAIRRGGMQTPTAASDVFQATASLTGARQNGDTITTTLDHADWHFARRTGTSYAGYNQSRITGWNYLMTDAGDAEASATLKQGGDQNKLEYTGSWHSADNDVIDYFWKRARSFLDIVTWTGTGSDMNISHNLGVVPEMIWARPRSYADHWSVFHKDATYDLKLDTDAAEGTGTAFGTLTSSVMPVTGGLKVSSHTYIAFLFATAAGVSKVGTYTGNGSSQNIDCGFSGGNGASFVMIKNIDATGSWVVFDTARGLVTGNDVYIRFDVTNAEGGGYDFIDPLESGFTINQTGGIVLNESGENYLFWAIA